MYEPAVLVQFWPVDILNLKGPEIIFTLAAPFLKGTSWRWRCYLAIAFILYTTDLKMLSTYKGSPVLATCIARQNVNLQNKRSWWISGLSSHSSLTAPWCRRVGQIYLGTSSFSNTLIFSIKTEIKFKIYLGTSSLSITFYHLYLFNQNWN